jgi:flagellar hook-associated protein 2
MAITSPTYDPATTAAALAENYIAARQGIQTSQTNKANSSTKALNELKAAISSYQASLFSLATNASMLAQSATFSDTAFGSATATAAATPGSADCAKGRVKRYAPNAPSGSAPPTINDRAQPS